MSFWWKGPCLWVVVAMLLCVSAEKVSESRSGLILELQAALNELVEEGKGYLGNLAGKQTLLSVFKAFSLVLGSVAENVTACLNVFLQCVSHLLQTTGIQVGFPIEDITPQGVIFVTQWLLVAVVTYWILSCVFRVLTYTLRQALWLLKVCAALACLGYILSDRNVPAETMAYRIGALVLVCLVLDVRPSRDTNLFDKTSQLEKQVRILERRLTEMERRGSESR